MQVLAAQVVEVSATFSMANNSQTIQVLSGADLVQAQSSQLTKSFDYKMVAEIPTVSGQNMSVLNLAVYLPNTTTALGGTSGSGGSIGGLRGRQNSFSVDGVNNNDPSVTTVSQQVIPDAVQEFSLSTNQFSAEVGSAAGGQSNVVTKGGAIDVLHGAAIPRLPSLSNGQMFQLWSAAIKSPLLRSPARPSPVAAFTMVSQSQANITSALPRSSKPRP